MILGFSDEHEDLRQVVRGFLAAKSPESEVRRLVETDQGYDPGLWKQMVAQLDLPGIAVAEDYGGSGFGQIALTVVFEEMGRALFGSPYFSTAAMAATLLQQSEDAQAEADYLPGIAAGATTATVAMVEAAGRWDESGIAVTAKQAEGAWALNGEKHYVLDGHVADLVLVVARTAAGISVFAVEKAAGGYSSEALPVLDRTRPQARLAFDSTPARLIGVDGEGWTAVSRMLDRGAVCLAAEQIGGARRILEIAVDYARDRVQFGRRIGAFQAIKHRCAELFIEIEAASAALRYATWAASVDSDELPVVASIAKVQCSEAYIRAASECIQIHGAIGFTWEHPAHLYLKRAKSAAALLGGPAHHRNLVGCRIGGLMLGEGPEELRARECPAIRPRP